MSTVNTSLPAGTDNQAYCYDEQNRLTWAGSTGTAPCQSFTPGTLTAADYTQSYAYDTLNRLTTGPLGPGYTYGDTNHLDAVTSAPGYTATYDAAGDMACRAPTSSQSCPGSFAQALSYDILHRLSGYINKTKYTTATATYVYDGENNRVEQLYSPRQLSTTTTQYIGAYEEIVTTGSTSTTTKYYNAGVASVENDNGTLYYLVGDDLGSVSEALTATGTVQAVELYAPYGAGRYSSGSMPTEKGFTGQQLDPIGLSYFHARYYDSVVGQFVSADPVQGPNRYGYVAGNPTTFTDPSGQMLTCAGAGLADGICIHNHDTGGVSDSTGAGARPCLANNDHQHCGESKPRGSSRPGTHDKPRNHYKMTIITPVKGFEEPLKCFGHVGCINFTYLELAMMNNGTQINGSDLAKAFADLAVWIGAVGALILAFGAINSQDEDPLEDWAIPREIGLWAIGLGGVVSFLSTVVSEFLSAFNITGEANNEVSSVFTEIGSEISGAGAGLALAGGIMDAVSTGWEVVDTLRIGISALTLLGSFVWLYANMN